jgi:hypothetical protein
MAAVFRTGTSVLTRALILGVHALSGVVCARAEEPKIIIQEDFEAYTNVAMMNTVWPGGTAQLQPLGPGRGRAASHDGAQMNNSRVFLAAPDSSHDVFLSADFYDFATNTAKKVTLNLRNGSKFNLDIGMVNGNMFSVRAQGFSPDIDWIPIVGWQPPVPGWKRITATISQTNVHVTFNGTNSRPLGVVDLPVRDVPLVFKQLRFGGFYGKPSIGGPVLVDNILLAWVEKSAVASLPLAAFPQPPAFGAVAATPLPASPQKIAAEKKIEEPIITLTPAPAGSKGTGLISVLIWWIFVALGLIILLLGGLLFTILRGHQRDRAAAREVSSRSAEPKLLLAQAMAELSSDGQSGWRERALAAEAVAGKQAQILKEKVGSELVEFAKETVVQGLYAQRNALLETQQRAQQALSDLESHLTELHLPQSQRVQEYEKRIAELEKALDSRNEEMRELTRATLMLVRRRLEQEKLQQPSENRLPPKYPS